MIKLSVEQILQRFPRGFAVSPEGEIYEIIEAKKRPQDLGLADGYLGVRIPVLKPGDEYYGQREAELSSTPQKIADEIDRLLKIADTLEEDEIISRIYQTYSERLKYAEELCKLEK